MALTWDISKIKDYKKVCWNKDESLTQTTYTLVFTTISVGIGTITETNVDEFYKRLHFLEKLYGAYRIKGKKSLYFTKDEVEQHIGLSTNVSFEPTAKWLKRQYDWFE